MDIIIKRAFIEELEKLMKWRMEVLHHVFAIPENEITQNLYIANQEYYKKSLPSGRHIAVFAEMNGATAGCGGLCLYREMPSPDNPSGKCAYLMNIYTREEYRGHGVGNTIVRWLVDCAKEQGITKIYLEASECGRALYENIGFRDMQDYMKL